MAPSFSSQTEVPWSISFSGSGFLATYQLGVAQCFLTSAPWILKTAPNVLGASAGSLVAAGVVCEMNLLNVRDEMVRFAKQMMTFTLGPLNPSVNVFRWLEYLLLKHLPADAHILANNRLAVAVTRFSDGKQIVISEYQSKEDVVQALLCSCFVPGYCGVLPPSFKGVHYLDGGFSGMQPIMPFSSNRTLTICPFSGEMDICPKDPPCMWDLVSTGVTLKGNMANSFRIFTALYPMALDTLEQAFHNGYKDAINFLQCKNLAPSLIVYKMSQEAVSLKQSDTLMPMEMTTVEGKEKEMKVEEDLTALTPPRYEASMQMARITEQDLSGYQPVEEPTLLFGAMNNVMLVNVLSYLGMFGLSERLASSLLFPFMLLSSVLQSERMEFLFRKGPELMFWTWHNMRHSSFFFFSAVYSSFKKNMIDRIMLVILLVRWLNIQAQFDIRQRRGQSSPWKKLSSHSEEVRTKRVQQQLFSPSLHYKKTAFQYMLRAQQTEM